MFFFPQLRCRQRLRSVTCVKQKTPVLPLPEKTEPTAPLLQGDLDMFRRTRMKAVAPVVMLFALTLAAPALAEDDGPGKDGPFVSMGAQILADAEFDDGEGEVGSTTAFISGGYSWLNLSYARTDYSWSDVGKLAFGNGSDDPWDTLHALAVSSEHDGMFNDRWGWFAGAALGAAYEDEMSGAWEVSAYGGGVYVWDEHTTVTFGLGASEHETGFGFLPLFGVQWDYVGEDGAGWYAALGLPETNVGYAFSRDFSLTLELGIDDDVYRLADDSKVIREGYVGVEDMSLSLAADWTLYEDVTLTLAPSYHWGRSMTLYDKNGDKEESYDLNDSFGALLNLSVDF